MSIRSEEIITALERQFVHIVEGSSDHPVRCSYACVNDAVAHIRAQDADIEHHRKLLELSPRLPANPAAPVTDEGFERAVEKLKSAAICYGLEHNTSHADAKSVKDALASVLTAHADAIKAAEAKAWERAEQRELDAPITVAEFERMLMDFAGRAINLNDSGDNIGYLAARDRLSIHDTAQRAEIARLQSENERMREVLDPFQRVAGWIPKGWFDSKKLEVPPGNLTVGDFRRAALTPPATDARATLKAGETG